MQKKQAVNYIELVGREWGIPRAPFLATVNCLEKDLMTGWRCEYEFSAVEGQRSLRFLHLSFPGRRFHQRRMLGFTVQREKSAKAVIGNFFGRKENWDKSRLDEFFIFNRKFGPWPIQLGLEMEAAGRRKAKIYLSVNGAFSLAAFCADFNFIWPEKFKAGRFDSVALDLDSDLGCGFKFYPLSDPDSGRLWRFDKNGRPIGSAKRWKRYRSGLEGTAWQRLNFRFPEFIVKFIKDEKLSISYLCRESGRRSFYFR